MMNPYLFLLALLFFSCTSNTSFTSVAEVERRAIKAANIQSSSVYSMDQQGNKIVLREMEYDQEGRCIIEKTYANNTLEYTDTIAYNAKHEIIAIHRNFSEDSSELVWSTQPCTIPNTSRVYSREPHGYALLYYNTHYDLEKVEHFRDSIRIETEKFEYFAPSQLKSIVVYDASGEPVSKTSRIYSSPLQWTEYTIIQEDTLRAIKVQLNDKGLYHTINRSVGAFTDREYFTYENNVLREFTSVTTWTNSETTTPDSLTLFYDYFTNDE